MTEPILVEFFELKFKQLLLSALLSVHEKPSQPEDDTDVLLREYNESEKKKLNDEALGKFIDANLEVLKKYDVNVEARKPEYKLTKERQLQISVEQVGMELTIDSLYALLKRKDVLK